MKKEFKLEKVLDFRNRKLDTEKAKMRDLINNETNVRVRIAETAQLIQENQTQMDADNASGILGFMNIYVKFLAMKEVEMQTLQNARNEILKQIEAQKETLRKTLNDVKIMEKLKDKHLLSYLAYMNKLEEKNIDEVNITRRKDEEKI